jgi:hypothetical protein
LTMPHATPRKLGMVSTLSESDTYVLLVQVSLVP